MGCFTSSSCHFRSVAVPKLKDNNNPLWNMTHNLTTLFIHETHSSSGGEKKEIISLGLKGSWKWKFPTKTKFELVYSLPLINLFHRVDIFYAN